MKIGILTQPLVNNYGGILQNYALQTILKKLGHDVITLDVYPPQAAIFRLLLSDIKTFVVRLRGKKNRCYLLFSPSVRKASYQSLTSFIDLRISKTEKVRRGKKLLAISRKQEVDAYIVGSDQVWRPQYNANIYDAYLDFAKGQRVKRIAYAVSFGVDSWEYSDKETRICIELVKMFDAISVREDSGIYLVENHLKSYATRVLDPTMLLSVEDYLQLIPQECSKKKQRSVFAYILDSNNYKLQVIDNVVRSLNVALSLISPIVNDASYCYPSIEEWLAGYEEAQFVVTDSFHGTVFSILFHKPFAIICNTNRGNARFDSLLALFGLKDRIVSDNNTIDAILKRPIDWKYVDEKLNTERVKSLDFLKNNLS